MYHRLIALFITIACLIGFIPVQEISAEQQSIQLPFNVQVQPHSLQDKNLSSYFKLDVSEQKGRKLNLQIAVKNITDENITIRTEVANALTSTSGGIDYNPLEKTEYASFINEDYAIKENITGLPKQLTLKGNETRIVDFQVLIPEESNGTYLAGVSFLVDATDNSSDSSFAINSVVGRTVAIQLDVSKSPVIDVDFADMEFTTAGGVPTIRVLMENHSEAIHPGASAPYTVYKKNTMEKVYEGEFKNIKMAPSTRVLYQIQWQGTIEPGDYLVKIGEQEKEFEIKVEQKEVEDIAQVQGFDVYLTKDYSSFWWILIAVFFMNLLFWVIYVKKKRTKELTEDNEDIVIDI